jgi:hypothetical protein
LDLAKNKFCCNVTARISNPGYKIGSYKTGSYLRTVPLDQSAIPKIQPKGLLNGIYSGDVHAKIAQLPAQWVVLSEHIYRLDVDHPGILVRFEGTQGLVFDGGDLAGGLPELFFVGDL